MSLFLLLLIISIPTSVFAVDYDIEETIINASLQENGNVEVKETHTYRFDGEFNGITRTLLPKENTSISNVRASESGTDLNIDQEDHLYKIYRSGSDETITIDLYYSIENGVNVYEDVAEFYWPFFDDSNESTYESMSITVEPPGTTEVKAAYGKDEAYGTAQPKDDGSVTFDLGEVPSGKKGDIRVAYESSLFSEAAITSEAPMLETIQAEKAALDQEVMAKAEQKERWGALAPFIIGGLALIALILMIEGWRKRKETLREAERQSSGGGSFPKETMSLPAMLGFMNHGILSTSTLTAALLDLVRKGIVEKVSDKEFKLVKRQTEYEHETILVTWLFDKVGADGRFHVQQLEEYVQHKENHRDYQKHFNAWRQAVNKESRERKLYEKTAKPRWLSGIAALAAIPFVILFPYFGLFVWMTAAIVLFVFFVLYAIFYQPLTIEGQRIKRELQPLNQGDEWKTWGQEDQVPALLYQIGAGKRDLFSKPPAALSSSNEDWMIYLLIGATLHSSFRSADQHATASASSGIGPGGGGTGVGGGGGGSGAF